MIERAFPTTWFASFAIPCKQAIELADRFCDICLANTEEPDLSPDDKDKDRGGKFTFARLNVVSAIGADSNSVDFLNCRGKIPARKRITRRWLRNKNAS